MLAIAVSVLFGLMAVASVLVIRASMAQGMVRARQILAELAEMEAGAARITPPLRRPERASPPLFAAA